MIQKSESYYIARRTALVREFMRLRDLHLWRCAAARVRTIAKLDLEHRGIPIQTTYSIFGYSELQKKMK